MGSQAKRGAAQPFLGRLGHLLDDIPTIYHPFSIASLRDAVRRFLAGQNS